MREFLHIDTEHGDLLHDVAYDYYGKRLATCSSDMRVQVWDLAPLSQEPGRTREQWTKTAEWQAHKGPVWKVTWAHPEFGQVIASASFDYSVNIWEESEKGKPWVQRCALVDHKEAVVDVAFAPKHLGLQVATCSNDGLIRIYQAIDVMNLEHWPLMDQFEVGGKCSCIAWNLSRFEPPTIAAGSKQGTFELWEYNEHTRRWQEAEFVPGSERQHDDAIHGIAWAPNLGRSYHLLATASKDQTVRIWQLARQESGKWHSKELACFEEHKAEVWRVCWNITGTILASSGDDGNVRLWKQQFTKEWKQISSVKGEPDRRGEYRFIQHR